MYKINKIKLKKTTCLASIICFSAYLLVGCVGNNSNSVPENNNGNMKMNSSQGSMLNTKWVNQSALKNENNTEGWGMIGIGLVFDMVGLFGGVTLNNLIHPDPTPQKLDEILSLFDKFNQAIQQINQSLVLILFEDQEIVGKIDKYNLNTIKNNFQEINSNDYASYTQFRNALGSESVENIAKDPNTSSNIAAIANNDFLRKLVSDASLLSDSVPSEILANKNHNLKDETSNAVEQLLEADLYVLKDKLNECKNDLNCKYNDYLDGYNSTLVNQVLHITEQLNKIKFIESVLLYLKYFSNDPQLKQITFAEEGMLNTNTYDQNRLILDENFNKRSGNLSNLLEKYIISDDISTEGVTQNLHLNDILNDPEVGGSLLYSPDILNMPTTNVKLYVWGGIAKTPQNAGIDSNGNVSVIYKNTPITLNYKEDCARNDYDGNGIYIENSTNRLMCYNLDIGGTHYHDNGKYITDNDNATFKIYMAGDNISKSTDSDSIRKDPAGTTYFSPPENNRHNVDEIITFDRKIGNNDDVYYDVDFSQDLEVRYDDGYMYYSVWDTSASIHCHDNDPNCRQLIGKDDTDSSSGYSRVCIDHHNIVLQDTHGDHLPSVDMKDYPNSPC